MKTLNKKIAMKTWQFLGFLFLFGLVEKIEDSFYSFLAIGFLMIIVLVTVDDVE